MSSILSMPLQPPTRIRLLYGPRPETALDPLALAPGRDLWITRSQLRRRALESAALEARGVAFGGVFHTLNEWVQSQYERLPGRLPIIGIVEQTRLLQRLLEEEGARPESPFRGADRRRGLAPRFRQLVANFKQETAAPETATPGALRAAAIGSAESALARMEAVREGLAERLHVPVLRVFERYQRELESLGLVDIDDTFLLLERALRDEAFESRPGLIVWEGWYLLNAVQRRLIAAVSARAERVEVLIDGFAEPFEARDRAKPADVAGAARLYGGELDFWSELGAALEFVAPVTGPAAGRLSVINGFLGAHPSLPTYKPTTWIGIERYERAEDEVRAIARRLASAPPVDSEAAPLRRAVAFPSLEEYGGLVGEIFPRYGLHFRLVDRLRVSRTAPARLLGELFDMTRLGFPRGDVIALLTSPLVALDLRDAEGRPLGRGDFLRLDSWLRAARFHGGKGAANWRRRIDRRRERLAARLAALERALADLRRPADPGAPVATAPEEGDRVGALAAESEQLRDDLRLIDDVGAAVVAQLETWEELTRRRGALPLAEGWIEAFSRLGMLQRLKPSRHTLERLPRTVVARDLQAWESVAAALGELGRVLALNDAEEDADGNSPKPSSITHDLFEQEVRAALESTEIVPFEPDDPEAILVLSRLDLRQMDFDEVYLGGLAAGAVPGRQEINIFFSERERRKVGWRTQRDTHDEWAYLMTSALIRAERLYLSWAGGDDAPASLFVEDIARAIGIDLAESSSINKIAAGAAPDAPMTTRERCRAARHTWDATAEPGAVSVTAILSPAPASRRIPGHSPRFASVAWGALSRLRSSSRRVAVRLAAEESRRTAGAPTLFDGGLQWPGDAGAGWRSLARSARSLAVTALESYATCPFRAWSQRLMLLQPLLELSAVPERNEVGLVVHGALARLGAELATAISDSEASAKAWSAAWSASGPRLAALIHEEAALHLESDDRFWQGELGRWCAGLVEPAAPPAGYPQSPEEVAPARGALAHLLELLAGPLEGLIPWQFEAGIGSRRGDSLLSPEPIELAVPSHEGTDDTHAVRIRGILDRLDRWYDPARGALALVLLDYKTGKPPTRTDLDTGRKFQLPLYLRALRQIFPESPAAGALYVGLGGAGVSFHGLLSPSLRAAFGESLRRNFASKSGTADEAVDIDAYLDESLGRAARALRAAGRGIFATGWLQKSGNGCAHCDFRRVCRVDHDAKAGWRLRRPDEVRAQGIYLPEAS